MHVTSRTAAATDIPRSDHAPPAARSWCPETFGPVEKLVLSYFMIYIELMLIAVVGFGYAGIIVMAVASAGCALTGLVIVTATGLR